MKKNILKHFIVVNSDNNTDLSISQALEKKLNEAKGKFTLAKKEVKDAKQKLNQAIEANDTPPNSEYWIG